MFKPERPSHLNLSIHTTILNDPDPHQVPANIFISPRQHDLRQRTARQWLPIRSFTLISRIRSSLGQPTWPLTEEDIALRLMTYSGVQEGSQTKQIRRERKIQPKKFAKDLLRFVKGRRQQPSSSRRFIVPSLLGKGQTSGPSRVLTRRH
jgi:hypothetical protein